MNVEYGGNTDVNVGKGVNVEYGGNTDVNAGKGVNEATGVGVELETARAVSVPATKGVNVAVASIGMPGICEQAESVNNKTIKIDFWCRNMVCLRYLSAMRFKRNSP